MMKWILSLMMMLTVAQSVACSDANYYDANYYVTVAQSEQDARQMDRRHYEAEFTKKLGSTIELFADRHIGRDRAQTVFDMNSNLFQRDMQEMLQSGAWVLTIEATDIVPTNDPAGVNSVVAHISFGEGGANTSLELSPGTGTSIQIASGQIRMSAYLEQEGPLTGLGVTPLAGGDISPPIRQRISAFIKRAAYWSGAKRAFYRAGPFSANDIIVGPVPNFAKGFILHSADPLMYDPSHTITFRATGNLFGLSLATYDGPAMFAAKESGQPLPIPVGASEWVFAFGAGSPGANGLWEIDFHLNTHD